MLKSAYFLKASLSIRREKQRQVCPNQSSLGTTYCENRSHEGRKKVKLESHHLTTFHCCHSHGTIYALPSPFLLIFSFPLKRLKVLRGGTAGPILQKTATACPWAHGCPGPAFWQLLPLRPCNAIAAWSQLNASGLNLMGFIIATGRIQYG